MNIEIGKTYYEGAGNGTWGTLALVRVVKTDIGANYKDFFGVEILENYASKWEDRDASVGKHITCHKNFLFDTFKEAKKEFKKSMRFKNDKEIVNYIFREENV